MDELEQVIRDVGVPELFAVVAVDALRAHFAKPEVLARLAEAWAINDSGDGWITSPAAILTALGLSEPVETEEPSQ